jgi:hypothetical protein
LDHHDRDILDDRHTLPHRALFLGRQRRLLESPARLFWLLGPTRSEDKTTAADDQKFATADADMILFDTHRA